MLLPWRKRRFCHFLYFRHGGNVIFLISRSSEASDGQKIAIYWLPTAVFYSVTLFE